MRFATGTLFGCLAKHKAMKDCRWDYDSYTCNYCTRLTQDEDIGHHVVKPSNRSDWEYYNNYYKTHDDADWEDLQMGMCGVQPLASYHSLIPSTRDECNSFQVVSSHEFTNFENTHVFGVKLEDDAMSTVVQ